MIETTETGRRPVDWREGRGVRRDIHSRAPRATRAAGIIGAALVALSVAAPAPAQARVPWTYDPHPPIVNFIACASAPDYPFGPTCPTPEGQRETRHRGSLVQIVQTRHKLWYYLGSDGGAVQVDPASEGFYASRWSDWRTRLVCGVPTLCL